jgi:hypothetical protein
MDSVYAKIDDLISFIYSFDKYVAPTVVLVPGFVDKYVSSLAEATGFDVETLEYTLGLFLCYPLGLIMVSLPYGKVKHLFSFLLGCFLLQFTIGSQWIHQLITSLITYVLFAVLSPKQSVRVVPAFLMIYMTLAHLHRQYINYLGYDMDFTGSQMVLTLKLYTLAYNLYDGHVLSTGGTDKASKKCSDVAVTKLPGIIEYLGYTFCFATILVGPGYEYKIYEEACDGTLLYTPDGKPKGKIPSQVLPTLKAFFSSLLCMGIFVVGNGMFPLLDPTDPQRATPVVITEQFLQNPWYYRYCYTWVALLFIRCKYYFAWKNAEGANCIWYAGFEGFNEKGEVKGWDNASNIDIIDFETAPNVKLLSAAWNKKTANWLSKYVYIRTGGSLLATYGLSAFWHGFYPGYYMFFLSVPILTACERLGRKKLTSRFQPNSRSKWTLWGLVCMISTSFLVQYIIVPFQLLAFDWGVTVWKTQYFFGHILCVVFYAVVSQLPSPKKKEA